MRLVIHVDLDAFYCQVERLRLQLDPSVPLAVQQWSSVIAVNYPARRSSVTRHLSVPECKLKCPALQFVHVATMSIHDPLRLVQYAADSCGAGPDTRSSKASLEPYRDASRAIFREIKGYFRGTGVVVEKASVDEAFLEVPVDYASFCKPEGYVGHPIVACVSDSEQQTTEQDRLIMNGTWLADDLRRHVYDQLGYTMSAGIARNKTLAKLASGRNKPNDQTYVLDAHIEQLMKETPFSKIRFLGGKLGNSLAKNNNEDDHSDNENDYIDRSLQISHSGDMSAYDLQSKSLEELAGKVGVSAADWVYKVIRGVDDSPVIDRSLTKSFMSAKQFRPALRDLELAHKWLRLQAAELCSRIHDEAEQSQRIPSTLTFYYRRPGFNSRSKACPLVVTSTLSMDVLFEYASSKLVQPCHKEHSILPLNMIGLSVSKFSSKSKNNQTISSFLVSQDKSSTTSALFKENSRAPDRCSRWSCSRCSAWYEADKVEKIQEHTDFHVAMDIARMSD